jgi:hypothetical protein
MPRVRTAPVPPGIERGVYLTDGERLYRVLEVLEQNVELEDCGRPEELKQWLSVGEVLQKMTLVRAG